MTIRTIFQNSFSYDSSAVSTTSSWMVPEPWRGGIDISIRAEHSTGTHSQQSVQLWVFVVTTLQCQESHPQKACRWRWILRRLKHPFLCDSDDCELLLGNREASVEGLTEFSDVEGLTQFSLRVHSPLSSSLWLSCLLFLLLKALSHLGWSRETPYYCYSGAELGRRYVFI